MSVPQSDALNLATNNKWIAMIPFKQIAPDLGLGDLEFNLYTFNLPEMEVSSTEITYQGYSYDIPTNVKNFEKTVTFEYLVSSDWSQYKALWKWVNQIVEEIGTGRPTENKKNGSFMVPIHMFMLSEFKKPIFEIIYHDCWIKSFGSVTLDYQDADASVVTHSFTCAYSHFTFNPSPIKT